MMRFTLNKLIPVLVLCGLGIWALLQPYTRTTVDIGGDMRSGLRDLDTPYIDGFWPVEPRPWTPRQGPALRWSHEKWRISWPQAGIGWWTTSIRIDLSGRDTTTPARVVWQEPGIGTSILSKTPRNYHVLVHTSWNATPTVAATVNPFFSGNDKRALGIAVTRISLQSIQYHLPGLSFVWLLMTLVWCWWLTTYHRGWGVITGVLCTLIYVAYPQWTAVHSTLGVLLWGSAISVIWLMSHTKWVQWQQLHLIAALGVAQLLALWSPWLRSSDIAMHVRMLRQVLAGNLLFTAQLPCEAGAYISPYPPLTYLVVAPFAMISGNSEYLRMLLSGMAVLLNLAAIIYMMRVLFAEPTYQRYIGLCIVIAGMNFPLMRAIHTGEMSNAMAHGIVTIALLSWVDSRSSLWWRIVASSMALLAHTGNSITFMLMVSFLAAHHVLRTRALPSLRSIAIISIPLIPTVLYYVNFLQLIGQVPGYPGCPPTVALAIRIQSLVDVVPLALLGIAVVGIWLIRNARITAVLAAGIGAACIAIGMLLVSTQTVRWGLSVMPFLAVAATWPLVRLWRYGNAGRLLTPLAVLGYVWLQYSATWHRVLHYLHD